MQINVRGGEKILLTNKVELCYDNRVNDCRDLNTAERMPYSGKVRKALFKAALELADLTAEQWCDQHGDVTTPHLYRVLSGERESPPLESKIDAFIEMQFARYSVSP